MPSELSVRTLPIHEATATSYVAVCTNAWAARVRRCSRENPPPRTAISTEGYSAGSVTMATLAWFLAAARTIEGPPMSICSTHSSCEAPDCTVSVNG